MSCDNYYDLWQPFSILYKKYWNNNPYKTYICTETKQCPYFDTIKTIGSWTSRLKKALEQIDSEYIIFMLDDYFIREYVDQERINYALNSFKGDVAVFNFELLFNTPTIKEDYIGFGLRHDRDSYLNNTQPSIHNRLKLIERLQKDQTIWEWETTIISSPYKFYINTKNSIIDVGHRRSTDGFAITRGKWAKECIDFFEKEKIKIDYSIRGKFEGKL